mmetsp:Transcript_9149/g.21961  ORF Transcript_9149/g.21961 Transcript_9149/m.21961 type:complete len:249 (+) Transcript_9149:18-764(+)
MAEDHLVLHAGPFPQGLVVEVKDGLRQFPDEVVIEADKEWAKLVEAKPNVFDGVIWTALSVAPSGGQLRMEIQRSTYRFQMYTHFTPAGLAFPQEHRANALGTAGILLSLEGRALVGRRSTKLATCPGLWHLMPAGTVDKPDILAVLMAELKEECGMVPSEVAAPEVLGVFSTGEQQGGKPEVVWTLPSKLSEEEVLQRCRDSAVDKGEHDEVAFVWPGDVASAASVYVDLTAAALSFFARTSSGKPS